MILVWSGSVAPHVLPVIIGNVVCGVFIWVTSGIDRWKVSFIGPFWLILGQGDHFSETITLSSFDKGVTIEMLYLIYLSALVIFPFSTCMIPNVCISLAH